ncbi:uncharacterized protein LOC116789402 [Chiroxiphia lanceolata]|uniref:uncharacterized protein LOC116789402 n=1 Tax=Chiroxiphia lanceolata TaxID=296741 RepID=UPI0013CF395E|nr:uncharacterized protein LOC116789402 [Chiroxiphia lanceolata]
MANSDLHNAETSAVLLDLLMENGVSNPKKVPAFVRYIHRWLMSSVSPEHRLDKTLLDLAEAHPVDVVVTLLCSAPSCDRFAVLTIKALLRHLRCEGVVMALERKCGWDTLLDTDSHHYAVGLLAREMVCICAPWCCSVVCCLLELLSKEMCPWELPAMAFLVEVLVYLDVTECGESILQILSGHLWSECPEMRRQVLRGLMVLSQDPVMAKRMGSLTERLEELLWDSDRELVRMTATVLEFLSSEKDI